MSGPFGAGALQFFGGDAGFYTHTIGQSLRFGDGDGGYLSKTFGTPTNAVKWTLSVWVKSCGTGVRFLDAGGSAGNEDLIGIGTTGYEQVYFNKRTSSSYDYRVQTTQLLRDPSAWYHCVTVFDRDNSTSSDRQIIYINGERVTALDYSSYPSSSAVSRINTAVEHRIGATVYSSSYDNDGYIAEMTFVDGQALAPTSFGETKAGIWIPKNTSGLTFGNNGFRLQFQDSSSLGDDTSGNGNDFSVTNLASTDVVLDSPTNNWCTINRLNSLIGTLSEGNLRAVTQVAGFGSQVATVGRTSGKWYWEVIPVDIGGAPFIGVVDETYDALNSASAVGYLLSKGVDSIGYYQTGALLVNTTAGDNSYGTAYAAGDIIGVALNLDDNQITFYKNNSSQGVFSYTFSDNYIFPAVSDGTGSAANTFAFNFGQDSSFAGTKTSGSAAASDSNGVGDFYYTPPSGFLALCTANFADPAIDPAEDEEPADYFNTLLYTGDGSSSRSLTGVGFQPDWVWLKDRSTGYQHSLQDSTRGTGANKKLYTSLDEAEGGANSVYGHITAFDSDGFSVATGTGGAQHVNHNTVTYVAWNWKVNGGTTTNVSAGSGSNIRLIGGGTADQAAVQANTESGISIVSFENTARSSGTFCTFPHGLNSAPNVVWLKSRTSGNYWAIYHSSVSSKLGFLGSSLGGNEFVSSTFWNAVNDTTVKFDSAGNLTATDEDIIAYCFQNLDGYFRAGSYHSITGVNSTGAFVYTGFRPAWVLTKREVGTSSWILTDNKRSPINVVDEALVGQSSSAELEPTGYDIDFLSNGFKIRGTNAALNDTGNSGRRHLYLAYAEQPAKYSNAR